MVNPHATWKRKSKIKLFCRWKDPILVVIPCENWYFPTIVPSVKVVSNSSWNFTLAMPPFFENEEKRTSKECLSHNKLTNVDNKPPWHVDATEIPQRPQPCLHTMSRRVKWWIHWQWQHVNFTLTVASSDRQSPVEWLWHVSNASAYLQPDSSFGAQEPSQKAEWNGFDDYNVTITLVT